MNALAKKLPNLEAYERLNISKLAMRFDLDRITVRKRIIDAGIEPIEEKAREKIYELTPDLDAVLGKVNDRLEQAKLRVVTADAELREAKAAQMRGDLVPAAEVTDNVQRLFGAMHKEIAVRMPKEIASKLAKAKTAPQVAAIIKAATDKRFKMLRDDFEKYLI